MTYQVGYDHPNCTIVRQDYRPSQSAASATDFAFFRSALKCVVTAVHIVLRSIGSAVATITVLRNRSSTAGTGAFSASSSAGSLPSTMPTRISITLASTNTLTSLGETMTVRHDQTDGVFDVLWEYRILPDADMSGVGNS